MKEDIKRLIIVVDEQLEDRNLLLESNTDSSIELGEIDGYTCRAAFYLRYLEFLLSNDTIVAFVGKCEVKDNKVLMENRILSDFGREILPSKHKGIIDVGDFDKFIIISKVYIPIDNSIVGKFDRYHTELVNENELGVVKTSAIRPSHLVDTIDYFEKYNIGPINRDHCLYKLLYTTINGYKPFAAIYCNVWDNLTYVFKNMYPYGKDNVVAYSRHILMMFSKIFHRDEDVILGYPNKLKAYITNNSTLLDLNAENNKHYYRGLYDFFVNEFDCCFMPMWDKCKKSIGSYRDAINGMAYAMLYYLVYVRGSIMLNIVSLSDFNSGVLSYITVGGYSNPIEALHCDGYLLENTLYFKERKKQSFKWNMKKLAEVCEYLSEGNDIHKVCILKKSE